MKTLVIRLLGPLVISVLGLNSIFALADGNSFSRIISIGSSTTEIIYALGLEDRIVAVDTTSLYPSDALKNHPNVGYMRALSAEPILSLQPDIVVSEEGAEPGVVLRQLEESGVEVLIIPKANSIEGVYSKINLIAEKFDRQSKAEQLISQMAEDFEQTTLLLSGLQTQPKTMFILGLSSGAINASGASTSANDLILYAGGANVFDSFHGYKPVTPEAIINASPEVIILPSHSIALAGGLEKIMAIPEISLTPAAQNNRIYVVDSTLALGFGPRLPEAIRLVAEHIKGGN